MCDPQYSLACERIRARPHGTTPNALFIHARGPLRSRSATLLRMELRIAPIPDALSQHARADVHTLVPSLRYLLHTGRRWRGAACWVQASWEQERAALKVRADRYDQTIAQAKKVSPRCPLRPHLETTGRGSLAISRESSPFPHLLGPRKLPAPSAPPRGSPRPCYRRTRPHRR